LIYYQENAPIEIAIDFNAAINSAVMEIGKHPERFSRWHRMKARKCIIPRFPYLIFYIDRPEGIRILAIAHTSRRPGYWKKRIAVD
jgi:plasmid stabilization system protein ParE